MMDARALITPSIPRTGRGSPQCNWWQNLHGGREVLTEVADPSQISVRPLLVV